MKTNRKYSVRGQLPTEGSKTFSPNSHRRGIFFDRGIGAESVSCRDHKKNGRSVETLVARAEVWLTQRGVPESRASAEFLMAAVLGIKRGQLWLGRETLIGREPSARFWNLIRRRGQRWPLGHILGTSEFLGVEFAVTPKTLIPRPETELLAQAAIEWGKILIAEGRPPWILDVGTGSGCLAVTIARALSTARVTAVDSSFDALQVASRNARRHRLDQISFVQADLFKPWTSPYRWADLLVSNPPYISSGRLSRLEPEVLREPRLALDGGPDGLRAISAVIDWAAAILTVEGGLLLEIDDGQGDWVGHRMEQSGFAQIAICRDLAGLERLALGRYIGK